MVIIDEAAIKDANETAAKEAAAEAERLAAFSQQLGISQVEEDDFSWIAEVGLQSPLPPRWTSHTDDTSGFVYYVDHDRQVSSWENPLVPYLRRVVEIGRAYLKAPSEVFFEDQKGLLWHEHKHELDCWNGPFADGEGRTYFVNASASLSSWQDPRIDAQYIFELESGLLTSLQEVLPPPEETAPQFGDNGPGGATATSWKTAGGADVLTLDGGRPDTGATIRKAAKKRVQKALTGLAQKTADKEHKSTLETMGAAADRLHNLHQDDVEAQRLQLLRAAELRKQRRLQAKLAPPPPPAGVARSAEAGLENMGPESEQQQLGPPCVPPSPSAGKKPNLALELQQMLDDCDSRAKSKDKVPCEDDFIDMELPSAAARAVLSTPKGAGGGVQTVMSPEPDLV